MTRQSRDSEVRAQEPEPALRSRVCRACAAPGRRRRARGYLEFLRAYLQFLRGYLAFSGDAGTASGRKGGSAAWGRDGREGAPAPDAEQDRQRMKIVHYIPSLDRASGGTAAYMALLARELGKSAELHVVTHRSPCPLPLENCRTHYISSSLCGRMAREWVRVLSAVGPDVVHVNCCWLPQCALVQELARRAGYKTVLTPHGMLEPWIVRRHYWTRKLPALLLYQRHAVRSADCLHATAPAERENLSRLGYNANIVVIPNGICVEDIRMKTSWRRSGSLLFLSRIHRKKGLELLLEALAGEMPALSGYELTIAGEGDADYVGTLRLRARQLGLDRMVRFVGGVYGEAKWALFRKADLFVLPTYSENFGIVVAEALACGTPVLTTTGTPWEDLRSCRCGWWTDCRADSLAAALAEFAALPESALEAMGRNGRRLVEDRYSARTMAAGMLRLYRSLRS